jgi:hypothetical protein
MYTAITPQIAAASSAATRRRLIDARGLIGPVAGLTACGLVVALAWESGGYFPDARLRAGAIAFGALAVLLLFHTPRGPVSRPALLALGALAALTAWTGFSSRWSSTPDVALDDFQRDLLYIGLLGLGLLAAGSGRWSRHLVWAVFLAAASVLVGALWTRMHPDGAPPRVEVLSQYRLGEPLGYWNALGALGAMVVVLGAGLATDLRSHPLLRGLSVTLVVAAGTAAYLSFSRGAWLAFFVGLAVLCIASPRPLRLLVTLALCGAALAVVLLRLRGLDALTGNPDLGSGRAAQGRELTPLLIGVACGAGVLQAAGAWLRPHPEAVERLSFLGRRAGLAIATVVLAAGAVVYLTHADRVEGKAAARLTQTDGWITRQWRDFMRPTTFSATGSERLTSAKGTRSDLFRVAIDGFQADPLKGGGAGSFEVRFAHDRRVPETVRDAHSLYLETLGELGLVGAVALVGLIGAFAWAAVLTRLRPRAMGRAPAAAASAALAVWAAHCIVDWDWQMPALTAVALLLATALMPIGLSTRRRSDPRGLH